MKKWWLGMVDTGGMANLSINFNLAERFGLRALANNQQQIDQSLQRLSTGKRINRASDDAAGLIGSEALKSDQAGVLAQIQANTISAARYAAIDGGLSAVQDQVSELHANIVEAANSAGLSDDEKAALQVSTDSIVDAIQHTAGLQYNGEQILQQYIGASATASVELTAGAGQTTSNLQGALDALRSGGAFNLTTGYLEGADQFVTDLGTSIASSRAAAGALQNGLDAENRSLATENENLSSAISQITDTDYASEVGSLVRSQALADAAQYSVQAARKLQAESVLSLIKPAADSKDGKKNA